MFLFFRILRRCLFTSIDFENHSYPTVNYLTLLVSNHVGLSVEEPPSTYRPHLGTFPLTNPPFVPIYHYINNIVHHASLFCYIKHARKSYRNRVVYRKISFVHAVIEFDKLSTWSWPCCLRVILVLPICCTNNVGLYQVIETRWCTANSSHGCW